MVQADKAAKAMSSRLANMKFMQRASAGSASSSPRTAAEPAAKRQRLSNGSGLSSPATPHSPFDAGTQASPQEGDDPGSRKRPYSSFQGESEWYLNVAERDPQAVSVEPALRIVSAGYSTIDAALPAETLAVAEEEDNELKTAPQLAGRRSFGKFNKSIEKQQKITDGESDYSSGSSDDDEEDEPDDISDDPNGTKAMIAQSRREATERARAERKAKRKSDSAESIRLAEERRKKEVNLNRLTSISGGGSGTNTPSRQNSLRDVTCYKCGGKGHISKDCPRWAASRLRRD